MPISDHQFNIVLIDDNPVICRFYTRLFQKAGYIVSVAQTGEEGFTLIQENNSDAAVIDFHLPDINSLEINKRVKAMVEDEEIKVILFTANEDDETKKNALDAGVDAVVVKSPDACEIVAQVENVLTNIP